MVEELAIGIPSLNQGRYLEDCLNSLQCEAKLSVFVADGGSTDETIEILKKFENIIDWRSEQDFGQADAINKAFSMIDGSIMGYMNCDDMYVNGGLDQVVKTFEKEDVDIVIGWALNLKGQHYGALWGPTEKDLHEIMWLPNAFEPAVFWRRHVWESEGPFDVGLHYVFGWDFLCRAIKRFKVKVIKSPIAVNRLHGLRKTFTGGEERAREILSLVERFGPKEKLAYYRLVRATKSLAWVVWPYMRPIRLRELAYSLVLPELSKQMTCDEALRIRRVLYG